MKPLLSLPKIIFFFSFFSISVIFFFFAPKIVSADHLFDCPGCDQEAYARVIVEDQAGHRISNATVTITIGSPTPPRNCDFEGQGGTWTASYNIVTEAYRFLQAGGNSELLEICCNVGGTAYEHLEEDDVRQAISLSVSAPGFVAKSGTLLNLGLPRVTNGTTNTYYFELDPKEKEITVTNTLNVKSSGASNVDIYIVKNSTGETRTDATPFSIIKTNENINYDLRAPKEWGGRTFIKWEGCDSVRDDVDGIPRWCRVVVKNGNSQTVTAKYQTLSCTLTVKPNAIESGGKATLSWTTEGAESATLTRQAGTFPVTQLPDGSREVGPTETFTFIMTVKNKAGLESDCRITLFVTDPLTCSLAVEPQYFTAGKTSILSWKIENKDVTAASIDPDIGAIPKEELASGSRQIVPQKTTTYIMTAQATTTFTRKDGTKFKFKRETTCLVVAHVLPACTLSVLPTAIRPGDTAELTWTTVNAKSGRIDPQVGDITDRLAFGKQSVRAIGELTFRLTAVNEEGQIVCEVTLHMLPTCTISANPKAILRGRTSTLSWKTLNTQSASIDDGGTNVWDVSYLLPSGFMTVSPQVDTFYTMTVTNQWGNTTCLTFVDIIFSALISPARGTICDFTVLTIRLLATSAFLIALFLFILAGIRFVISRGDERELAKARSSMLSTGVGLTIIVAAASIIFLIEYFFQVTIFKCPVF